MSNSETPADSAACALKERVNQAFLDYEPREVFNALKQAENSQNKFLLLGTGICLFTVNHDNVGYESVVRQDWTGEERKKNADLWLNVAQGDILYGTDVLDSGLFGRVKDGKLTSRTFPLDQSPLDLCNLFFALASKMCRMQDIAALSDNRFVAVRGRGYELYTALAMHIPGKTSVDPCRAEIVMAVKIPHPDNGRLRPETNTHPPLFNFSKYHVLPNPIDNKHPPALPPHKPSALYVPALAHKLA
jgi:hypothetical protein